MEELRIAAANWEYGGIDRDTLSRSRWDQTIGALRDWTPHVVLCQEMTALFPWELHQHAWRTANALEMVPLLGHPGAPTVTGNRPAILVSLRDGLTVTDHGPAPSALDTCWCDATVDIPGFGLLRLYSVHLPAFSGTLQRVFAEWLTARIVQHGQPSIVAGDWNSYSGEGMEEKADLTVLAPHLIPTRMCTTTDGIRSMNTNVHDLLTVMGLRDAAVLVPPACRTPSVLRPTGRTGVEREFRGYVTGDLASQVTRYEQAPIGSDHEALLITLRLAPRS